MALAATRSCLGWPSSGGAEAGQAGGDRLRAGVGGARLLLQRVLGDVDVDRPGPARTGQVERLGQDARQLVRVTDEVVVLGHGQRDARDVDLLEGVLAEQGGDHVAGDGDDGDRIQLGRRQARHEVRGARAGGAEADAHLAAGAGEAVGRVRRALLVADEHVPQGRVVAQHVVQRQDHPAGVAEEDVASPPAGAPRRRRPPRCASGLGAWPRAASPRGRHRRPRRRRCRRLAGVGRSPVDPSWSSVLCCLLGKRKTLATRRGSWFGRSARPSRYRRPPDSRREPVIRPMRPRRRTRIVSRRDGLDATWPNGTGTRRPSAVMTTATKSRCPLLRTIGAV